MITNLDSSVFPVFEHPQRAQWVPVFLSPIRGSQERLVIGVAVFNDQGHHIEAANALHRLQCLYGSQADIVIQVAGTVLDDLRTDMTSRGGKAIVDFRPTISGVTIGPVRAAEAESLQAVGASWMAALSSLYDNDVPVVELDADDPEASYEEKFGALAAQNDRLPKLVLDYVVQKRLGLAPFFRGDIDGKKRRHRSHEISIDFTGSRLVANFGTLQIGHVSRSVGLIKRRLWDLKVDRDSETSEVFRRNHEMLIQMPAIDDPQVSERQLANLQLAREALETQADQEELRMEAFTSVEGIGERILAAEINV